MADDENKIKKWIKKWQKDKGDIGAGEENPHITGPEEKLREAADKGDIGAGEENPHITGPEEKLREAADKGDIKQEKRIRILQGRRKNFEKQRKTFEKRQRKLTKMRSLAIPCRPKT